MSFTANGTTDCDRAICTSECNCSSYFCSTPKVTTCRQKASDQDSETQWVLEFVHGIESRPSLREPLSSEALMRHGTRVSLRLSDKTKLFQIKKSTFDWFDLITTTKRAPLELAQLVGALAPALEVDVFTQEGSKERVKTIASGDWRDMESSSLIARIAPGTVALYPEWRSHDLGVATSNLSPMIGATGEMHARCAVTLGSNSVFGLQAGIVP